MAKTYEPIATTTLGSAASSITFSSIPNTYTDLRLVLIGKGDTYVNPYIQFNSDTAGNYSATFLYGSGSAAGSSRDTNESFIKLNLNESPDSTYPGFMTADIFSYAGSTNKTVLCTGSFDENGAGEVLRHVGLWRSTSAITTIIIGKTGQNFATGTVATLYGILKA